MADQPERKSQKDLEEEVWSAISAFEQILQAMPKDRGALDVLSHAYEQIGDHTRAKEYTVRLAEVMLGESDSAALPGLLERLRTYAPEDPAVQDMVRRIEQMTGGDAGTTTDTSATDPGAAAAKPAGAPKGFNIANELSFAWGLLESEDLTQEEYSGIVQDLSEMGASEASATVSVLHVLESRGFRKLDRIMGRVAKECDAPFVSLGSFELQLDAMRLLPREFMVRRGAVAFGAMGGDLLVVVMNPYDQQLRHDVASLAGRRCHFFMTLPSEFDRALDRFDAAAKEAEHVGA